MNFGLCTRAKGEGGSFERKLGGLKQNFLQCLVASELSFVALFWAADVLGGVRRRGA